jgi:hypothetical protein|nr:hypothetical protein [uncultured Rhodopila sp.]
MSGESSAWPPGCSREAYIRACVDALLQGPPTRRTDPLAAIGPEWRSDFDAEIARQAAPTHPGRAMK